MAASPASVVASLVALVSLVAFAAPAGAHSAAGGADATKTRLLALRPAVAGIDVEVIENGSRVQVTNTADEEVVVLGYQGEPYLRVGPEGVLENHSPTDREGSWPLPGHERWQSVWRPIAWTRRISCRSARCGLQRSSP